MFKKSPVRFLKSPIKSESNLKFLFQIKSFSLPKLRLNPGSGKCSREQMLYDLLFLALVLPLSLSQGRRRNEG